MSRKKLTGLDPSEYEHPLDKAALEKLEAIPGVKSILKKLHEVWFKDFGKQSKIINYF